MVTSKLDQYIDVAPNPSRDYFSLSIKTLRINKLEISLVNSKGIVLFQGAHRNIRNSFTKKYASQDLSPDVYLLGLKIDGKTIVKKIIRE